jgi:nucleoid-associated protein YgaU
MSFFSKLFGGGKKEEAPSGVNFQYSSGPGDTCRSLAKRFYGDEAAWEKVYNPNRHLLKDEVQSGSDKLLVGTGLTIKDPKFDMNGQPV